MARLTSLQSFFRSQSLIELESKNSYNQTPLSRATRFDREAVVKLLLEGGADPESKDNGGRTPLSVAAEVRCMAVVKLLLEGGAELESKDVVGRTPLSLAAETRDEALVKLLVEAGPVKGYGWSDAAILAHEKQV